MAFKLKFLEGMKNTFALIEVAKQLIKEFNEIKDIVLSYNSDKDAKDFSLPGKEEPDYKQANAYLKYAIKLYLGIGKAVVAEAQDGD